MVTLKEQYGLSYDISRAGTSLTLWYDRLIDKTSDNLDILDICRMLRHDIVKELATPIAIEMLMKDPFDGFLYGGELLAMVVEHGVNLYSINNLSELSKRLRVAKTDPEIFELIGDIHRPKFLAHIDTFIAMIEAL